MLKVKRIRKSRQESRAATRERLLASAREVFAKNGYSVTSVDLIAENAGYSKGAFYSNFESKEEVFLALLESVKESEISTLEAHLAACKTAEDIVERLGEFYLQLEEDLDWCLLSAEFQVQASRDRVFAKHVSKFYRGQRAALGRLLERLYRKVQKKLPAPPEDLAALFIGLATGLSLQLAFDKAGVRKGLLGDSVLIVLKSLLARRKGK